MTDIINTLNHTSAIRTVFYVVALLLALFIVGQTIADTITAFTERRK